MFSSIIPHSLVFIIKNLLCMVKNGSLFRPSVFAFNGPLFCREHMDALIAICLIIIGCWNEITEYRRGIYEMINYLTIQGKKVIYKQGKKVYSIL